MRHHRSIRSWNSERLEAGNGNTDKVYCEDKEGICKGVLPAGEPAGARDSLSAVPPEELFNRNQLKVQYPPLCKEIFSFTVPVFPIQGLESTTAVESRALEENLFLRRARSPALIYNTSQYPPFLLLSHLLPPLHFPFTTPNATEEVRSLSGINPSHLQTTCPEKTGSLHKAPFTAIKQTLQARLQ